MLSLEIVYLSVVLMCVPYSKKLWRSKSLAKRATARHWRKKLWRKVYRFRALKNNRISVFSRNHPRNIHRCSDSVHVAFGRMAISRLITVEAMIRGY